MITRAAFVPDIETQVCPMHGEFNNEALVIGGVSIFGGCPECRAQAELRNADILRREAAEEHSKRVTQLKRLSNVPGRYIGCTIDSFVGKSVWQIEVRETMRAYVENFDNAIKFGINLVLTGVSRSGKSHIGCALVNALVNSGRSARYTSANDLLIEIREASRMGGSVIEITRPLMSTDLLVIDDVGSQGGTANDLAHLFRIINTRHAECRPTVLISHLDLGGLAAHLNDRVVLRLLEQSEHFQFSEPYQVGV